MQVGDLVKTSHGPCKRGLLIEKVRDRLTMNNKVFKVLWNNGVIGSNIWDYDLEVISESR